MLHKSFPGSFNERIMYRSRSAVARCLASSAVIDSLNSSRQISLNSWRSFSESCINARYSRGVNRERRASMRAEWRFALAAVRFYGRHPSMSKTLA